MFFTVVCIANWPFLVIFVLMKSIKKHKGIALRRAINKLGLKIKDVSRISGIGRGTLYNYFKKPELDDAILVKLGKTIRYDFSIQFPELIPLKMMEEGDFGIQGTEALSKVQMRYYRLLEDYTNLLKILARTSINRDFGDGKELIDAVLDSNLDRE